MVLILSLLQFEIFQEARLLLFLISIQYDSKRTHQFNHKHAPCVYPELKKIALPEAQPILSCLCFCIFCCTVKIASPIFSIEFSPFFFLGHHKYHHFHEASLHFFSFYILFLLFNFLTFSFELF